MRDLSYTLIWIVLLPAIFMSAYVGALLWIWIALLSPNELLYGVVAEMPFNKIIAVATLFTIFASQEKKDFYADATTGLLVLFGLIATISWMNALTSTSVTDDLYFKLLKEIVLALVIMLVMTTRRRIHLAVFVIVVSLGFIGVKEGLIYALTVGGHKVTGTAAVGDNNSLASALLMIVPLLYYLFRYSAVRLVRVGMMTALVLCTLAVVATASRGGFLGLLVLALFAIKNSRNKVGGVLLVVVIGAVIYFTAPDAWFSRVKTIDAAASDDSFMGRVIAWKVSWLIAMDRPLFGGGFHAVQQWPVWNAFVPHINELDLIKTPPPADSYPHAAHSIWFEVLGDLGFIGLAVFVALLLLMAWNTSRIYHATKRNPEMHWAADLARMFQISLVTYMVTASALSMGYFELIYILIALVSRLRRIADASLARTDSVISRRLAAHALTHEGIPA